MNNNQNAEPNLNAVNQDFTHFDQVDKPQRYRLSESGETEEFDNEFQIRTVDMSDFFHGGEAGRERFANALGQAMEEIGFAVLVGHGVDATQAGVHRAPRPERSSRVDDSWNAAFCAATAAGLIGTRPFGGSTTIDGRRGLIGLSCTSQSAVLTARSRGNCSSAPRRSNGVGS